MYGLVYGIHLGNAYLVGAFQAEAVVYRYDAVACIGHLPEPLVVAWVVSCAAYESSSEHEDDGRFIFAVYACLTAWCRIVYIHEEVASVSLHEHVCAVWSYCRVLCFCVEAKYSCKQYCCYYECLLYHDSFPVMSFSDGMSLLIALM